MLSVKLSGTVLHVKFEGFLGGNDYKNLMNLFNNLPGAYYWEEKYTWIIPKEHVDSLIELMGEDKIAWFNSIEEIKGIKETLVPEFQLSDEGLEDLHLSPYPFQAVGISFLHDVKKGILADEMGLGKTPQAIGAIHRLWKKGEVSKALIVCPTSLKYQWKEEISKFTDHKGIVIDGTRSKERSRSMNLPIQ
ncbi:DEAD/DEAH box helicase [Bacillus stercoris]|nr:DEAD/DEAH box helicase [Bacillus stercoris]